MSKSYAGMGESNKKIYGQSKTIFINLVRSVITEKSQTSAAAAAAAVAVAVATIEKSLSIFQNCI